MRRFEDRYVIEKLSVFFYVNLHFSIFVQRLKCSFHLNGDTSGILTQPQTLAKVLQSCGYKITLRTTRFFFCYYQVKCHQYWPEGEETLAFGSLEIICTKIRDFTPSYIYREMYVTDSKVSRKFVKKSNFFVNTAFLTSPLSAEFC